MVKKSSLNNHSVPSDWGQFFTTNLTSPNVIHEKIQRRIPALSLEYKMGVNGFKYSMGSVLENGTRKLQPLLK